MVDEKRRYGFAYGTLPEQAEAGEERFTVEWLDDDSVWYDILALSRKDISWRAWLYPVARHLRDNFRRDSGAAMERVETSRDSIRRAISSTVVLFHHGPALERNQDTGFGSGVQRARLKTRNPMKRSAKFLVPFLACGLYAADADKKPDQAEGEQTQVHETTRRPHIRFGGLMIGAGYTHWSGGWCCGYPAYGYYGAWMPFFPAFFSWDPFFYSPYYGAGFTGGPNMGEVKLHADLKDAEVFLDGAYAGTAAERKSIWLDPGAYNLEVRAPGKRTYTRRIYVLSGKALRVNARLETH